MMKMALLRRLPMLLQRSAGPGLLSSCSAAFAPSISASPVTSLASSPFTVMREFSSKTPSKEDDIKVPLLLYGVAGKYASSLYVVALRANALETVLKELREVIAAAENVPTFADFMKDLSVPADVRVKAVQDIFEQAGFCEITINFLAILAERGRLRQLPAIVKCVSELVMAYKGEIRGTVTSVIDLSPNEVERLKVALKRFIKPGQTVLLDQKIDKSIMGGLVVDIGDKHIDLSIATKVKQMEKLLSEPISYY
eukprot:c34892_g1_i1 orf=398-1159(-)